MTDPEFDASRFSVTPMTALARWVRIVNPVVALFELLLGVRKPDHQVLENEASRPLVERFHVPCSACGGHTRTVYYRGVVFGAFAGLVCGHCGAKVASMPNVLTRAVQLLTWPLWRPFHSTIEPRLLQRQFKKLQAAREAGPVSHRRAIAVRAAIVFTVVFGAAGYFFLEVSGVRGLELWGLSASTGSVFGAFAFWFYDRFSTGAAQ